MNGDTQAYSPGKEIAMGIISCFVLNVLHAGIAFMLLIIAGDYSNVALTIAYVLIVWFGLLQLTYVIPLFFALRKKGRPDFARGMLFGASLTFLLSTTCWGFMIIGKIKGL